ncbi:MAG: S41 family peptidase [Pseudomonadota bacterium]
MINGNDVDTLNNGLFPSAAGESHEFTIQDLGSSSSRTVTLTAQVVTATQVQNVTTIDTDTGKVGYMYFDDHNDPAEQLLIDAFTELRDAEVTDLVLDLRYNPGGLVGIASEVAYMIAGRERTIGKTFTQFEYNDKYTDFDPFTGSPNTPIPFVSTSIGYSATPNVALPQLNLDRVFVLTTADTCSASELIMNALRGIDVEVILIGRTTCGKPYGFVPEDNCGTTYFSIQFRGINAKGFGDYGDGLSPSSNPVNDDQLPGCSVADDLSNALGDPNEGLFSAALYYRENGSCPSTTARPRPGTSHLRTVDGEIIRMPWESIYRVDDRLRNYSERSR